MALWRSGWLHLSHWWCRTTWSTHIASCTLFKPFLESIRTCLLLLFFSSVADFCFLFISFLTWWSPPFKGGFRSIWDAVHNKVGGCTIVMYFHIAMVNKKSNNFGCFASCLCCKLFIMCFLRGALIAFQREKKLKIFFVLSSRRPAKKKRCLFVTRPFCCLRSLCYF